MYCRVPDEWTKLRVKARSLQVECSELKISDELVLMLIIGEDHRFFTHHGVDIRALFRSVWRIFQYPRIEGGSTIAMQLVRVLTGNYQKNITRKLIEIFFAIGITKLIGKKDLPKMYLIVAYYGWKMDGLHQAAERLNFSIENANPEDSAQLIARLKYPEPQNASQSRVLKINNRVNHILNNRVKFEQVMTKKWKHLKSPMS